MPIGLNGWLKAQPYGIYANLIISNKAYLIKNPLKYSMQNNLKNLTILYVEDEPMIRQNAVEYLSRVCDNVLEAKDGLEALEVYRKKEPDIIISDIKMPRMSGLDMAEQIRQSDKKTPIIIATAHTETHYLLKAVELQLIKYIVKPITSIKLNEALNMAYHYIEENQGNILEIDNHTVYDKLNKTLIRDGEIVKLTKNEHLLLELFAKHHQRATTYQEIENYIWSDRGMSMDALRSLVRALRKKLGGDYIDNVSGIGYRLV